MRITISSAVLLAFAIPVPAFAQTDPARTTVQALDDGLIAIMKAKGTTKSRSAAIGRRAESMQQDLGGPGLDDDCTGRSTGTGRRLSADDHRPICQ